MFNFKNEEIQKGGVPDRPKKLQVGGSEDTIYKDESWYKLLPFKVIHEILCSGPYQMYSPHFNLNLE